MNSGDPGSPGSVFAVDGWPADKPFISSWAFRPRLHPVGDMILTAPIALLYSYTGLSFTDANKLLIVLFLIYVHVSLFLFARASIASDRARPFACLVLGLVYLELIHWTLEGFYEGAVIAPILLCGAYLEQRRSLPALFAFTVAANLHFRSYFFAPLVLYAVWILIHEKQWRQWRTPQWILACGTLILGAASLGVFALLWPALSTLTGRSVRNPVLISSGHDQLHAVVATTVVIGAIVILFIRWRAWLDLAIALWIFVMLLFMRETLAWDVVSLLAWLGLPVLSSRSEALVRDVRLAAVVYLSLYVFGNSTLLAPTWIHKVFT